MGTDSTIADEVACVAIERANALARVAIERADAALLRRQLADGADSNRNMLPLERSYLHECVQEDWLEGARLLLDFGADPNCRDSYCGEAPLQFALGDASASAAITELLLARGAQVQLLSDIGQTLLHVVSKLDDVENLQVVLAHARRQLSERSFHEWLNATDDSGCAALHLAHDPEVVRVLLEAGARVDIPDREGNLPLHCLCADDGGADNLEDAASLLCRAGAEADAQNHAGETPLHRTLSTHKIKLACFLIEQAGARSDISDAEGLKAEDLFPDDLQARMEIQQARKNASASQQANALSERLCDAAAAGDQVEIGRCLDEGAKPNGNDPLGRLPLVEAVISGSEPAWRALLNAGADPANRDACHSNRFSCLNAVSAAIEMGNGPACAAMLEACPSRSVAAQLIERRDGLSRAAYYGYAGVCEALLDWGVPLVPAWGTPALHPAAAGGRLGVIRLLEKRGCDMDQLDGFDRTALHAACEAQQLKATDVLLELGANPNFAGMGGLIPLMAAARTGTASDRLIGAVEDINARDSEGRTALFHAAQRGHRRLCERLLRAGADPNVADCLGRRPADVADSRIEALLAQFGRSGSPHVATPESAP